MGAAPITLSCTGPAGHLTEGACTAAAAKPWYERCRTCHPQRGANSTARVVRELGPHRLVVHMAYSDLPVTQQKTLTTATKRPRRRTCHPQQGANSSPPAILASEPRRRHAVRLPYSNLPGTPQKTLTTETKRSARAVGPATRSKAQTAPHRPSLPPSRAAATPCSCRYYACTVCGHRAWRTTATRCSRANSSLPGGLAPPGRAAATSCAPPHRVHALVVKTVATPRTSTGTDPHEDHPAKRPHRPPSAHKIYIGPMTLYKKNIDRTWPKRWWRRSSSARPPTTEFVTSLPPTDTKPRSEFVTSTDPSQ